MIEAVYEEESSEVALANLLPLAESGNAVAQLYVGHLIEEESIANRPAALAWYRRSSEGGNLDGTHYLASYLYHGFGTGPDLDEALRLFRRAAEAGVAASQWALGRHLAVSPETRAEGVQWLTKAAAQGHPDAKEILENLRMNVTPNNAFESRRSASAAQLER